MNDALDAILVETSAAIVLANHTRKEPAATLEAQGFGSTFVAARADGTFDLERTADELRKVRSEARFEAPEEFFLHKETVADGELIRWCEARPDAKKAKRVELLHRVQAGESIRKAAEGLGVNRESARRWVDDSRQDGEG